jgi:hypothetical protein
MSEEAELRTATIATSSDKVITVPSNVEALNYSPDFQGKTLVFSSNCAVFIDVSVLTIGGVLAFTNIADEGEITFEGEFEMRPPGGLPFIGAQGYLQMTYLGGGIMLKTIENTQI